MDPRRPGEDFREVGLIDRAIDQTEGLAQTQLELARRELQHAIREAKPGLSLLGVGAMVGMSGAAILVAGLGAAVGRRSPIASVVGSMFLLGGGVAFAWAGWQRLPPDLMARSASRLARDAEVAIDRRTGQAPSRPSL